MPLSFHDDVFAVNVKIHRNILHLFDGVDDAEQVSEEATLAWWRAADAIAQGVFGDGACVRREGRSGGWCVPVTPRGETVSRFEYDDSVDLANRCEVFSEAIKAELTNEALSRYIDLSRARDEDEEEAPEPPLNPLAFLESTDEDLTNLHTRLTRRSGEAAFSPEAEQHFLGALALLDAARRSIKLAHYAQMKGR